MSNSSTDALVGTIADSFFAWIQNDILPVCMAACELIIIIGGLILNILLIVTFKKKGLLNEPSSHFVLMLSIADFIAYAFVLIPNVITAVATKWILSDPLCEIHGAMKDLLILVNFIFLCVLAMERALKLYIPEGDLHFKLFENKTSVTILTIAVWALASVIAFIPVTGVGDIKYGFYHQGCMLDYTGQPTFLIIHFVLVFVVSSIVFAICYSIIFEARRKALIQNRAKCFRNVMPETSRKTLSSSTSETILPTINETDDIVFNDENPKQDMALTVPSKHNGKDNTIRRKSSTRKSLLFEVFSDDEENPAFHLAITYLALWAVLVALCLPYFIVWFFGTYNAGPLWGGFYTITLLLMHSSFAAKPIIYLGHNRHYRQVIKQTVPESLRSRARSVRTSISSLSNKVEDFVFRSNSNKQFAAALATQKAVLIWKKKLQDKKGFFKLKENQENSNNVNAVSITSNPLGQESVTSNGNNLFKANTTNTNGSLHTDFGRSNTATPSAVTISTSSFIEKERQKLLAAMDKTSANTTAVQNTSEANESMTLPGGINDTSIDTLALA